MLPQVDEEYAHSVKSNTKAKDKSKANTKAAAHDIQPDPLPVVEKFESKGGEGPANSAVSIGKSSNAKSSSKAGTDSENAIPPCNESVMLQCVDKTSNKFYEMKLELNFGQPKVTSRYGKIGSAGVTSFKEYASAEEAKKAYDNTLKEKIKKGYA
jgi:predicted DNA-binding WGR domain protein